jgi:hypothetical protein
VMRSGAANQRPVDIEQEKCGRQLLSSSIVGQARPPVPRRVPRGAGIVLELPETGPAGAKK